MGYEQGRQGRRTSSDPAFAWYPVYHDLMDKDAVDWFAAKRDTGELRGGKRTDLSQYALPSRNVSHRRESLSPCALKLMTAAEQDKYIRGTSLDHDHGLD